MKIFRKYYIAVYSIIFALAIIAFLLAYFNSQESIWQSTLLNLATELLGVVLVFFLVQYIFRVEEFDTLNRVNQLLEKLENAEKTKAVDFFHPQPNMDELIANSKLIKIVGVTLTVCIDKGMGAFRDALRNGASIKIVLIDGSKDSLMASAVRSETISTSYYEKKLAATMDNLDYLFKFSKSLDNGGSIEVKRIKFPPTVGIEVFDMFKGQSNTGNIKVEIYTQHTGWDRPPIFTVDKQTDRHWYDYFDKQFDGIWDRGDLYEPSN